MRTIIGLLLMSSLLVWAGCGGDDGNGTDPVVTETVVTAVTASSMTDVTSSVWSQATAKTIGISSGTLAPKSRPTSAAQSVASQISMQALVNNDTLYMRLIWSDASFDCWPRVWVVDSMAGSLPEFEHVNPAGEDLQDQMLIMFRGLPNSVWDVWHWKVQSTAVEGERGGTITGFAEGRRLNGTQLITDAGSLNLEKENNEYGTFNRPTFLHEDSMAFTGFILPLAEADSLSEADFPWNGWSLDDTIAGYLTDQSLASQSAANLNSRWDVRGAWRHASGQYTLVLKGPLDSGYDDDLEMTDGMKVPMKIILTNNSRPSFATGSADQGITALFYLQLP